MKKAAAAPMEKIAAAASLREMDAAAVWCEECGCCFAGMLSAEANSAQRDAVVSKVTRMNLMIEIFSTS